jgi:formiminotetrahydrofolate cyclodeaminase
LKSFTSFFGGKKKSQSQVHPAEEGVKTPEAVQNEPSPLKPDKSAESPMAQLELPTKTKTRSKKKRQAPLEAAMPVAIAVPLNGAAPVAKAAKTKTTKRSN